ncbi:MAG TPA: hypothetical protein VK861_04210 [Bacteroidales bacterium]|nr:hypothetical protein [Bacteroidales bacterium]
MTGLQQTMILIWGEMDDMVSFVMGTSSGVGRFVACNKPTPQFSGLSVS